MIHTVHAICYRDAEVQYYMFREVVTDVTLLYITLGSTDVIWSVSLRLVVHVAPSRKQEFPIGVITPTPSIVTVQRVYFILTKSYIVSNAIYIAIVCVPYHKK